ncbi:MAG TPA: nucleotide exchange factor GrpE [Solirubrobacteraceae bacterium]
MNEQTHQRPAEHAEERADEERNEQPGAEQPAADQRAREHEAHDSALADEVARLDDRYKRALADLDNYRKRSAREVERRGEELRDRLIGEWLEVVDSVERALRMQPDGALHEGLRAVLDQIESVLARQGVQRIGAVGERFDPERHEAIEVRPTDEVEDRTVLDVVRSGFAVRGRILRPAQVVVARRPEREG